MTAPELAVVIVTYNSASWIGRCLGSLPAALDDRRAEVVIVDNASADGSADAAAIACPAAHVQRNPTNVGFAAAVNAGVRASSAPWVLLLNPDMEARPGSLSRLLAFAERHPEYGVYGGRTLTESGDVERSSCWGLPSLWSTMCFALGLSTAFRRSAVFDPESLGRWDRDSVREVGMVTGCLLLVRREVWNYLEGLDERYFIYGEDADFSARARALGLRPVITPEAEVVHGVGKSSNGPAGSAPLVLAGKVTYARTHFSRTSAAVAVTFLRLGVAARALAARVSGHGTKWDRCWQQRAGWWDGFAES